MHFIIILIFCYIMCRDRAVVNRVSKATRDVISAGFMPASILIGSLDCLRLLRWTRAITFTFFHSRVNLASAKRSAIFTEQA